MPLENANFISQLATTNPLVGDDVSQGDDHIRMLKSVLQTTFPNASKGFYFPTSIAEQSGTVNVTSTDDGKVIPVNASGAARTVNLPAAPPDGFTVTITKTDNSANLVTIDPAGAVLLNGAATKALSSEFESIKCVYLSTFGAWIGLRSTGGTPRAQADIVAIAQGGTGNDTAAEAFDALSTARADVASASTVDLDTNNSSYNRITGVTTITAITLASGRKRWVVFDGVLTLTNGANLILPTGANIVTAAGDTALFVGEGASVVRCLEYSRAVGIPLLFPARAYSEYTTATTITTVIPFDDTIPQNTEGDETLTATITLKRANSRVRIMFNGFGCCTSSVGDDNEAWAAALFVDSAADALTVAASGQVGNNVVSSDIGGATVVSLTHEYAPGSVGPFTYKVRAGPSNRVAGSKLFTNGTDLTRLFGGTAKFTLIVEEVFV